MTPIARTVLVEVQRGFARRLVRYTALLFVLGFLLGAFINFRVDANASTSHFATEADPTAALDLVELWPADSNEALLGAFRPNTWVALFATTGVILSAAYALWLYRRVIFGPLEKEKLKSLLDLSPREQLILYPMIALTIFFGVYPAPVFDATAASVDLLVNNYTAAIQAAHDVASSAH